ncbi:MAG TPA: asparagine synthase-related protein, partial [Segetibacter sp.]|nr:asparagine synthase-related protein [Segetibacter sp.]
FAGYHHHFYKYGRELILKGRIAKYFEEVKLYAGYKMRPASEIHKIIINDVKLLAKLKIGITKERYNKEYMNLADCLESDFSRMVLPALLRTDDRCSMAYGVETRLPFMDYRIVEFASRLPDHFKINNGWQKLIIRQSAKIVPDEIRYRKDKKGFTTPQKSWMEIYKTEFESYLELNFDAIGITKEELKFARQSPDKLFRIYSLAIWLSVIKSGI